MPIDFSSARDFVYGAGTLFERALFATLFEGGSIERLQRIILCYKNADGGFGHGLEHDLKAPQSNPLALEYLLGVMKYCRIPPGAVLAGTADWVAGQMDAGGSLSNAAALRDYPMAAWWQEDGGQTLPDSIVGNLIHFGCATPPLIEKTKSWALANHSPDSIRANQWLFMAYHAVDFFFAISDFPDLPRYQQAAISNVLDCAARAPQNQYDSLLPFAPDPASPIAQALPADWRESWLDVLENAQQPAGNWVDQHSLAQWQPMTTINVLLGLRRYGRWA